jgi:hypothetical protein
MNRNLAGRCGMYCGACDIHRGFRDGGKARIEAARNHNCLPAEVRCEGCRAVHIVGWARDPDWGRNCQILRCQRTQSIDTCAVCGQLKGCDRWNRLAAETLRSGIDIRENLARMSKDGMDIWLAAQDERWRCQQCDRPVAASADNPRCPNCGSFQL